MARGRPRCHPDRCRRAAARRRNCSPNSTPPTATACALTDLGAELMGPTRKRDLTAATVIAAVAAYLLVLTAVSVLPADHPAVPGCRCWRSRSRRRAGPSTCGPRSTTGEIGDGPGWLHPLAVARSVLIAKASAWVGALVLGWWLGVLAYLLPRRSTLRVAGEDTAGRGRGRRMCARTGGRRAVAAALLQVSAGAARQRRRGNGVTGSPRRPAESPKRSTREVTCGGYSRPMTDPTRSARSRRGGAQAGLGAVDGVAGARHRGQFGPGVHRPGGVAEARRHPRVVGRGRRPRSCRSSTAGRATSTRRRCVTSSSSTTCSWIARSPRAGSTSCRWRRSCAASWCRNCVPRRPTRWRACGPNWPRCGPIWRSCSTPTCRTGPRSKPSAPRCAGLRRLGAATPRPPAGSPASRIDTEDRDDADFRTDESPIIDVPEEPHPPEYEWAPPASREVRTARPSEVEREGRRHAAEEPRRVDTAAARDPPPPPPRTAVTRRQPVPPPPPTDGAHPPNSPGAPAPRAPETGLSPTPHRLSRAGRRSPTGEPEPCPPRGSGFRRGRRGSNWVAPAADAGRRHSGRRSRRR